MYTPTKVVHSQTKASWNIVGTVFGDIYKVARVPYLSSGDEKDINKSRKEAYERAAFISSCFNNQK